MPYFVRWGGMSDALRQAGVPQIVSWSERVGAYVYLHCHTELAKPMNGKGFVEISEVVMAVFENLARNLL